MSPSILVILNFFQNLDNLFCQFQISEVFSGVEIRKQISVLRAKISFFSI